jgi:hypothetical protein
LFIFPSLPLSHIGCCLSLFITSIIFCMQVTHSVFSLYVIRKIQKLTIHICVLTQLLGKSVDAAHWGCRSNSHVTF